MTIAEAYKQGYLDGLTCFAWWKDGVEVCGTSATPLTHAKDVAEVQWNYNPPKESSRDAS